MNTNKFNYNERDLMTTVHSLIDAETIYNNSFIEKIVDEYAKDNKEGLNRIKDELTNNKELISKIKEMIRITKFNMIKPNANYRVVADGKAYKMGYGKLIVNYWNNNYGKIESVKYGRTTII